MENPYKLKKIIIGELKQNLPERVNLSVEFIYI